MSRLLQKIIGPRVTLEEWHRHRVRYVAPGVALMLARVLLIVSLFLPYWHLKLNAPQYPDGLFITAYINTLTGDVAEIDGLNHYIGMRPLGEAAQFEKTVGIWAMIALVLLVEGAMYIHSRWALVLVLPAMVFPFFFLGDLYFWMNHFGQNLDPTAPLSGAIKPFTPPILGVGKVGQFETIASMGWGLILAFSSAGITVIAMFLHRRAYKPLLENQPKTGTEESVATGA